MTDLAAPGSPPPIGRSRGRRQSVRRLLSLRCPLSIFRASSGQNVGSQNNQPRPWGVALGRPPKGAEHVVSGKHHTDYEVSWSSVSDPAVTQNILKIPWCPETGRDPSRYLARVVQHSVARPAHRSASHWTSPNVPALTPTVLVHLGAIVDFVPLGAAWCRHLSPNSQK
jgi:hypothetical protein